MPSKSKRQGRTANGTRGTRAARIASGARVASTVDELFAAAIERGSESFETGRYLITYREDAVEEGLKALKAEGMRVADARDFRDQAAVVERAGDADAMVFPEIGVALVGGEAAHSRGFDTQEIAADAGPIAAIEPEDFVFSSDHSYLRGFTSAANVIARDLGLSADSGQVVDEEEDVAVLGATIGLIRSKVPPSTRSGAAIKVAVLDTGFDLRHPDFVGRSVTSQTFVGEPVQDLHSHGTHCIGTACGPKAPAGTTPRYGIAYGSRIFVGKVLRNIGSSVGGSVLNGMNWAIANRCEVISMSLGGGTAVRSYYTAAGQAALNRNLLIVAAAGNSGGPTEAPANSPTIMAVASLNANLQPSVFSCRGKIEISGIGESVFSSIPMPRRYGTKSGTSMATPHVAGCAALWAQTNSSLRGLTLWRRLTTTAKPLPYPRARVGAGLVQAPA